MTTTPTTSSRPWENAPGNQQAKTVLQVLRPFQDHPGCHQLQPTSLGKAQRHLKSVEFNHSLNVNSALSSLPATSTQGWSLDCSDIPGFEKYHEGLEVFVSHSVVSDSLRPHSLWPARLLCPWDFHSKDTGVGCHFLLQGIFPTQGSILGLLNSRWMPYRLTYEGSPVALT